MAIFIPKLKEKGLIDSLKFTVFVVGSRKMKDDDSYGDSHWNVLAPNLIIYGFDADEEACDITNQELKNREVNWQETHFPLTLSNQEGESTLFVTKGVDCSSLYLPNENFLQRFSALNDHIKLDFSVEVETSTLDKFCDEQKINSVDFIYLDIQGAELKVLEGAKNLINKSVFGLYLEVEFASLYQGQPLFSDIDFYLRKQGFNLFDLITQHPMCRRPRSISPIYSLKKIGQLLWADALYLRDPYHENKPQFLTDKEQILKLACIADIFDYPDYSFELFEYLQTHYNDENQRLINQTIRDCLSNL